MRNIIFTFLLVFSANAMATGEPTVDSIPQEDFLEIDAKIQGEAMIALAKIWGASLQNFKVDWNAAECLRKDIEMDGSSAAVCMVPFDAKQVKGYAAVTVHNETYNVSIIYSDVE